MIYVIEIILFIIMSYIFTDIRNMKFYYWVLEHNKYTFDVWAQTKENFAYSITKIVEAIPTFSFAPTHWDYYKMREDWSHTYNIGEKFLIGIGMTFLTLKGIVGNVLIDVILVITFLFERKLLSVNDIVKILKKVDYGIIIESIRKYIAKNENMLLVTLIVFLAAYALYERKKIATYQLEAVWKRDETSVKQVANRQKEIENILLGLEVKIYNNSYIIKQNIRLIEARKNTGDFFFSKGI